jgi:Phage integrase family
VKVTKLTPHGMRHTMATLLLATGVHHKVVQERLGHSSIQMTLDLYSYVSATMQQDAADILDQLLGDGARQSAATMPDKAQKPRFGGVLLALVQLPV